MSLTLLLLVGMLGAPTPAPPAVSRAQGRTPLVRESSEWIPIELFLGSHVYLRGTLNGVETEIVVDSGAGVSVIDARFARRLGLARAASQPESRAGGDEAGEVCFLEPIELGLGREHLTLPRALELDVGGMRTRLGRDVPVILGRELFERFVVDLDYPSSRLALREPAGFVHHGPGRSLALRRAEGQLGFSARVEASIDDLPPAVFALDTGSPGIALLAGQHGLLAARGHATAVSGASAVRTTTVSSLTLAGYRFTDVPVSFGEVRAGSAPPDALAGTLGAEILSRFRVVFDASRGLVHLEPAADWDTRPFRRDRLGLAAVLRGDALEVTFVAPGSPAAAQGWKAGERILALGGKAVRPASWSASLAACVQAPAGTVVSLTDGEGRERRLVAADYP